MRSLRRCLLAAAMAVIFLLAGPLSAMAEQHPVARHAPPASVDTGKELPVTVTIDPMSTEIEQVMLYWGTAPDLATNQVVMTSDAQNATVWRGSIPAQDNSGFVWYFFQITYFFNNSFDTIYLPSDTQRYPVEVKSVFGSNLTVPGIIIGGALLVSAFIALEWARRARPKWNDRDFEESVKAKNEPVVIEEDKKKGPSEPRQPSG